MKIVLVLLSLFVAALGHAGSSAKVSTQFPLVATLAVSTCPGLERQVSQQFDAVSLRTDLFREVQLFSDVGLPYSDANPLQERFGLSAEIRESQPGSYEVQFSVSACQYYQNEDSPPKCSSIDMRHQESLDAINGLGSDEEIVVEVECPEEETRGSYHSYTLRIGRES